MKFAPIFILIFFLTCIFKINAQNIDTSLFNRKLSKIGIEESQNVGLNDTIRMWHCSGTAKEDKVFYYINNKCLGKSFVDKYFINPLSIKSIDIVKSKRKNGRNKIYLNTIEPFKWISSKDVVKLFTNANYFNILFEIDNKKCAFNSKVFFDKNFIKNISFIDSNQNFNNKIYFKKIIISSKKN